MSGFRRSISTTMLFLVLLPLYHARGNSSDSGFLSRGLLIDAFDAPAIMLLMLNHGVREHLNGLSAFAVHALFTPRA